MNWPARLVVGLTFVIWIALDVLFAHNGWTTESQVIASWAQQSTAFPCLIGILCGHWFINQRSILRSAWGFAAVPLPALACFDGAWAIWGHGWPWYRFGPIYVVLGMVLGALFWGQENSESPLP